MINRIETTELPHSSHERAAIDEDKRVRAIMQTLRETLCEQNVSESNHADEEGYYFVVESGRDVSVYYHKAQEHGSQRASSLRSIQLGLLKCCDEMARRGYTTRLLISPRTLALHVSD